MTPFIAVSIAVWLCLAVMTGCTCALVLVLADSPVFTRGAVKDLCRTARNLAFTAAGALRSGWIAPGSPAGSHRADRLPLRERLIVRLRRWASRIAGRQS